MSDHTPRTVLDGEGAVRAAIGADLGVSDWFEITAQRLLDYVAATGDGDGAFFAISLSNMFLPQIVEVRGFALGVNYGTQAVRLGTPLREGDRVRGRATLVDVAEVNNGIQTTMVITVETDSGNGREPCVIESLSRWLKPTSPEPGPAPGGTT